MIKENARCVCCNSNDLYEILDLTDQPPANSYHKKGIVLEKYPLRLNLCRSCYHLQISHAVDPDLLFKEYLYVSGTSKTMHRHFDWFSDFVIETCQPKNVLDIACNDGTQLDYFAKKGVKTFGIDPAENLYDISSKNHKITCDYFRSGIYKTKFDSILAQNVFAHVSDPLDFLLTCKDIMHDDSMLFIQTSQAEMVLGAQFDTIYHEHISFFNVNSMNELVKRSGLFLNDVVKTSIHGISYVFMISKIDKTPQRVKNLIELEAFQGLQDIQTYENYKTDVHWCKVQTKISVDHYRNDGYKIIGYGAAAKGMTFLNFSNLKLDVVVDDNELKQGLYTPGTDIEIVSVDYLTKKLKETDKALFIPLAWNYFEEIRDRILKVRNNSEDKFLKYFPKLVVI